MKFSKHAAGMVASAQMCGIMNQTNGQQTEAEPIRMEEVKPC